MSTGEKVYLDPELAKVYPNAKQAILLFGAFTEEDWEVVRIFVERVGLKEFIRLSRKDCLKTFSDNLPYGFVVSDEMLTQDFERFLQAKFGMV